MANEKIDKVEVEVAEVEVAEVEDNEVCDELMTVDEGKGKKFFDGVKAGAKKHKKKIIGGALAAGAVVVGLIKVLGKKDDDDGECIDFVDVEAEEVVEPSEVVE